MSIFIADLDYQPVMLSNESRLARRERRSPLYRTHLYEVGVLRLRNCFASRSSYSAQDDSFLLFFCCSFSSAVSGAFNSSMPSGNVITIFLRSRSVFFKICFGVRNLVLARSRLDDQQRRFAGSKLYVLQPTPISRSPSKTTHPTRSLT